MYQNHHDELVQKNIDIRARMQSSLTYSIANGQFGKAKQLINERACDLDETDSWWVHMKKKRDHQHNRAAPPAIVTSRTPLMYAILIAEEQVAYSISQQLVANNASLGLVDSNGWTALMYAAAHERTGILNLLLNVVVDAAELLCADKCGNTVMHLCSMGKSQANCHLVNKVAFRKFNVESNDAKLKNLHGHTPLDICRLSNHHQCWQMQYNFNRYSASCGDDEEENDDETASHSANASARPPQSRTTTAVDLAKYNLLTDIKNTASCASILVYEASMQSLLTLDEPSHVDMFETILKNQSKKKAMFQSVSSTEVVALPTSGLAPLAADATAWTHTYTKYLASVQEPVLIRPKVVRDSPDFRRGDDVKILKSFKEVHESNDHANEYEIVRAVVAIPLPRLSNSRSNAKKPATRRSILKQLAPLDEDSKLTWREQINKLFKALELEKSKSFRRPVRTNELFTNSADSDEFGCEETADHHGVHDQHHHHNHQHHHHHHAHDHGHHSGSGSGHMHHSTGNLNHQNHHSGARLGPHANKQNGSCTLDSSSSHGGEKRANVSVNSAVGHQINKHGGSRHINTTHGMDTQSNPSVNVPNDKQTFWNFPKFSGNVPGTLQSRG